MKIRITRGGIFGKDGEIAVGTELDVKEEPKGWVGRYEVISGGGKGKDFATGAGDGEPKTAAEVLEMAKDPNVQFMSFKAAATKLLGDKTPAKKDEIIAALEDLATQP